MERTEPIISYGEKSFFIDNIKTLIQRQLSMKFSSEAVKMT